MPPKKQTLGLIPIPNKIHFSQSLKKNSFGKGWNYPSSLPHKKKTTNGEEKKFLMPCPLFLKLHLQLVILSIQLNYPFFIPIETP
jgi:hypothetical protein